MTSQSKAARTIVVTGGADGIGRAVALLCAARGDNVAVLDKRAGDSGRSAEKRCQIRIEPPMRRHPGRTDCESL